MAEPFGTAASGWYSPSSHYGGTKQWRSTPFVRNYLDPQIPEGVFGAYLGDRGLGGTDAMSTWAQSQYGKTLAGYKSAMRENPALMYSDFLKQQFDKPGLQNMWLSQTARSRGENPTAFSAPTRIIGWG